LSQKKDFRKSMNGHTLTLGIDEDAVSMLDAFQEEAANIGADVSQIVRDLILIICSAGTRSSRGPKCMRRTDKSDTAALGISTVVKRGDRSDGLRTW
jgi:hypothetical protein